MRRKRGWIALVAHAPSRVFFGARVKDSERAASPFDTDFPAGVPEKAREARALPGSGILAGRQNGHTCRGACATRVILPRALLQAGFGAASKNTKEVADAKGT